MAPGPVSAASSCSGACSATQWPAPDDDGLHVVGDEFHSVPDSHADTFLAADGQHGQGQPVVLALLVLGDRGVGGAVLAEAAVQGVGVEAQHVHVVSGGVLGQPLQLRAEVDVLAAFDQLFV
jgi:hypothetical protein